MAGSRPDGVDAAAVDKAKETSQTAEDAARTDPKRLDTSQYYGDMHGGLSGIKKYGGFRPDDNPEMEADPLLPTLSTAGPVVRLLNDGIYGPKEDQNVWWDEGKKYQVRFVIHTDKGDKAHPVPHAKLFSPKTPKEFFDAAWKATIHGLMVGRGCNTIVIDIGAASALSLNDKFSWPWQDRFSFLTRYYDKAGRRNFIELERIANLVQEQGGAVNWGPHVRDALESELQRLTGKYKGDKAKLEQDKDYEWIMRLHQIEKTSHEKLMADFRYRGVGQNRAFNGFAESFRATDKLGLEEIADKAKRDEAVKKMTDNVMGAAATPEEKIAAIEKHMETLEKRSNTLKEAATALEDSANTAEQLVAEGTTLGREVDFTKIEKLRDGTAKNKVIMIDAMEGEVKDLADRVTVWKDEVRKLKSPLEGKETAVPPTISDGEKSQLEKLRAIETKLTAMEQVKKTVEDAKVKDKNVGEKILPEGRVQYEAIRPRNG